MQKQYHSCHCDKNVTILYYSLLHLCGLCVLFVSFDTAPCQNKTLDYEKSRVSPHEAHQTLYFNLKRPRNLQNRNDHSHNSFTGNGT